MKLHFEENEIGSLALPEGVIIDGNAILFLDDEVVHDCRGQDRVDHYRLPDGGDLMHVHGTCDPTYIALNPHSFERIKRAIEEED